jgi:hypothetical protein
MVDLAAEFAQFVALLEGNPAYLLLALGGFVLIVILLVVRHIRKIRGEEIFIHQAWGANWKGR